MSLTSYRAAPPRVKTIRKREARDYPAAAYVAIAVWLEKPARIAFLPHEARCRLRARLCPIFSGCRRNPPCGRGWRGGGGWAARGARYSAGGAAREEITTKPD